MKLFAFPNFVRYFSVGKKEEGVGPMEGGYRFQMCGRVYRPAFAAGLKAKETLSAKVESVRVHS